MSRYDDVRVERDDGVATVIIDRPPGNELVPTTMPEIVDAMLRAGSDPEIRCIVLTGHGRSFSRGADLSRPGLIDAATGRIDRDLMKRMRADHRDERGLRTGDLLVDIAVPIIAAVNGSAAGAGLAMTLQADIRVVAQDAAFSFAFAQRGITPELGATWLLPRLIGLPAALDLMLTGRRFDGREAERLGLAVSALPAEEVLPTARGMAQAIATSTSPIAAVTLKRMLWAHTASSSYAAATQTERDVLEWITSLGDAPEGIRAFVEKRAPQWTTTGRETLPGCVPALVETVASEY